MNNLNIIYLIIFSFLMSIFLVEILIFSSFISNEINKRKKEKNIANYYYNNQPARFFITGDKHRNFDSVKQFCDDMCTTRSDVLIVLGDAGFNYYDDQRDDELKEEISSLNLILFCLQGNKECRPENVGTYGIKNFCGGKVYYEPKYPTILFAIDGEIYDDEICLNTLIDKVMQMARTEDASSEEFVTLSKEISEVKKRISEKKQRQSQIATRESRVNEIIDSLDVIKNCPIQYDDKATRKLIDCIKVMSKTELLIIFKGGIEKTIMIGE